MTVPETLGSRELWVYISDEIPVTIWQNYPDITAEWKILYWSTSLKKSYIWGTVAGAVNFQKPLGTSSSNVSFMPFLFIFMPFLVLFRSSFLYTTDCTVRDHCYSCLMLLLPILVIGAVLQQTSSMVLLAPGLLNVNHHSMGRSHATAVPML